MGYYFDFDEVKNIYGALCEGRDVAEGDGQFTSAKMIDEARLAFTEKILDQMEKNDDDHGRRRIFEQLNKIKAYFRETVESFLSDNRGEMVEDVESIIAEAERLKALLVVRSD